MNSASFWKRLAAYVIDIFIVSFIYALVTINVSSDEVSGYYSEMKDVYDKYVSGEIGDDEYLSLYYGYVYDIEKASVIINVVYLAVNIAYFIVFQFLNGGETLGKKAMHIKVVNRDGESIGFGWMCIRCGIINSIFMSAISLLLVVFGSKSVFLEGYNIVSLIFWGLIFVSVVMMIYRKDHRALHDMLSLSYVVNK